MAPRLAVRASAQASAASSFAGVKVSGKAARRAARRAAVAAQAKVRSARTRGRVTTPGACASTQDKAATVPLLWRCISSPGVRASFSQMGTSICCHVSLFMTCWIARPPASHCSRAAAAPHQAGCASADIPGPSTPPCCLSLRWQIGDTLEEFLLEATPDPKLRQLMMSMSEAVRTIAYKVRG